MTFLTPDHDWPQPVRSDREASVKFLKNQTLPFYFFVELKKKNYFRLK